MLSALKASDFVMTGTVLGAVLIVAVIIAGVYLKRRRSRRACRGAASLASRRLKEDLAELCRRRVRAHVPGGGDAPSGASDHHAVRLADSPPLEAADTLPLDSAGTSPLQPDGGLAKCHTTDTSPLRCDDEPQPTARPLCDEKFQPTAPPPCDDEPQPNAPRREDAERAVSMSVVASPAPEPDARLRLASELCDAARARFQAGDQEGAIRKYVASIELDDRRAAAHAGLGLALNRQGDHAGAVRACEQAIRLDPLAVVRAGESPDDGRGPHPGDGGSVDNDRASTRHLADVFNCLGESLSELDRDEDCVAAFREAIRVDPDHVTARINLAMALEAVDDLDGALQALESAVKLGPRGAEIHTALGRVYRKQQRSQPAIVAFRKAIELDPSAVDAHNNLGNALCDRGLVEDAVACYRRVVELDPGQPATHANLGNALTILGDYDEAIDQYERAIELDPMLASVHYNLACAHAVRRREHEAMAALRKAVQLDAGICAMADRDLDFDRLRHTSQFDAVVAQGQ